jgi:hypothetical protein
MQMIKNKKIAKMFGAGIVAVGVTASALAIGSIGFSFSSSAGAAEAPKDPKDPPPEKPKKPKELPGDQGSPGNPPPDSLLPPGHVWVERTTSICGPYSCTRETEFTSATPEDALDQIETNYPSSNPDL